MVRFAKLVKHIQIINAISYVNPGHRPIFACWTSNWSPLIPYKKTNSLHIMNPWIE